MSLPVEDPIAEIKAAVIIVILVILLAIIGWLAYTKSQDETQIATQETAISALTDQNSDFKKATEDTNAVIQKMQTDALAQQAAEDDAVQTAQRQAASIVARETKLLALKPVGNDCDAAKIFAKQYYGGHP